MAVANRRYVVGLGNPGRRYRRTRHNLGFMVVEALAERWGASRPRRTFGGLARQGHFGDDAVMLLEPMTFMNASGQSVAEMMRFYKAEPGELLVVLDDMDLPPGRIRVRPSGSAGGHKGLGDVLARLGTDKVARVRLGIGSAPPPMDPTDYVLGVMDEEELALANEAVERACLAVEDWLALGTEAAMSRHNGP